MIRTAHARPTLLLIILLLLVACEGEDIGSNALPADGEGGFVERSEGEHVNEGTGTEEAGVDAGSGQAGASESHTGTLTRGEGDEGCIAMDSDGELLELLAGEGLEVRADPDTGELTGADGETIAQVGDQITVDGELDSSLDSACGGTQVLVMEDLSAGENE